MCHMIHNDGNVLHQKIDDTNKVYTPKNQLILTAINVWRQCLPVKRIIFPMVSVENK